MPTVKGLFDVSPATTVIAIGAYHSGVQACGNYYNEDS